mgnify:CR=1 FL=1
MIQFDRTKIIAFIILVGFIYSVILGVINTKKYDNYRILENGNLEHSIIRTDVREYWTYAYLFKKDLESGKNFFKSGEEHQSIYLYPKFIALYFITIDEKIKDTNGKFVINNFKFGIPIIQSIIYYLILILLAKEIRRKFSNRISIFIVSFLALEPTIIQYHSSYWTESLYFSMLLLIIYFFIKISKSKLNSFIIGLLIGLSFLQRSVSLYLILPFIIAFIINFRKEALPLISFCLIGYLLVVFFLGYSNFIRSGNFYVIPWDQKDAPFYLVAHKLNKETNEEKYFKRSEWIKENNINIKKEEDRLKLAAYQHQYFKNALEENFLYFIRYHIWKSLQALIFDPFTVQNSYTTDKTINNYWEKYLYQFYYKIPYSLIIYLLCLIGFISMINNNNENRNLAINIFLICSFYVAVLGWVGTPRYLVPNLIFLSFYFGFGLDTLIAYIKKLHKNK